MVEPERVAAFARDHNLWVIEDAAHAFPAAWRQTPDEPWLRCGENTAAVTCFSFYANKTITTGEGGMAVTGDKDLAERMRLMSLHGLSSDAWGRYAGKGGWDYRIVAPGFKYNMSDIAAALGVRQLARAATLRRRREQIAERYYERLADIKEVELPPSTPDRLHSWHLFPIRLRLDALSIDRDEFLDQLLGRGVGCSVHWRPLHLHPYYRETYGASEEDLPVASALWRRLISLPIFPTMNEAEQDHVVGAIRELCRGHSVGPKPLQKAAGA